jgi:hypothetical protein
MDALSALFARAPGAGAGAGVPPLVSLLQRRGLLALLAHMASQPLTFDTPQVSAAAGASPSMWPATSPWQAPSWPAAP